MPDPEALMQLARRISDPLHKEAACLLALTESEIIDEIMADPGEHLGLVCRTWGIDPVGASELSANYEYNEGYPRIMADQIAFLDLWEKREHPSWARAFRVAARRIVEPECWLACARQQREWDREEEGRHGAQSNPTAGTQAEPSIREDEPPGEEVGRALDCTEDEWGDMVF